MPRTVLLPLEGNETETGVTPAGLESGAKSCFLTEEGVATLCWGLYGVGLGVRGVAIAADVLGALVVAVLVVVTGTPELAVLLCSL